MSRRLMGVLMSVIFQYALAQERFPGEFLRVAAVSRASLRRCPDLWVADDHEPGPTSQCTISPVSDLGATTSFATATITKRFAAAGGDTVEEPDVVLFQKVGDGRLQAIWHYSFDSGDWRSVTPEVRDIGSEVFLISIRRCMNGTGGCAQQFAGYSNGRPRTVVAAFLDSLERRWPGAIRHGFNVDMRTLQARVELYSDDDANCCPSQVATLTLRLKRDHRKHRDPLDSLKIDDMRVQPLRTR
jgi:hypothetical protein